MAQLPARGRGLRQRCVPPVSQRPGTAPVIRQNPTRKKLHPFDSQVYRGRNVTERAFCRLNDWRRVATRYDKLARNFASTVVLAAIFRCQT